MPAAAAAGGPALRPVFRALATLRLYRRLFLLERPLDEPLPDFPLPPGVAIERLGPDDLDAYAAFRPEQGRAACERRLAAGHWCYATRRAGGIVGAVWLAAGWGSIDYLGCRIRLGTDEVYTYDLYTAPAARGLGLTRASRVPHLRLLRALGYRRVLGSVSPDNDAAWALQAAVGFRRIGRMGYVGIGPWRRHFCRPLAGAAGLPLLMP